MKGMSFLEFVAQKPKRIARTLGRAVFHGAASMDSLVQDCSTSPRVLDERDGLEAGIEGVLRE